MWFLHSKRTAVERRSASTTCPKFHPHMHATDNLTNTYKGHGWNGALHCTCCMEPHHGTATLSAIDGLIGKGDRRYHCIITQARCSLAFCCNHCLWEAVPGNLQESDAFMMLILSCSRGSQEHKTVTQIQLARCAFHSLPIGSWHSLQWTRHLDGNAHSGIARAVAIAQTGGH